jgi:ankyrin repeat protein
MLVRLLLDWGADPLATGKDGYNVWHAVAFQGRVEVLRVLIERTVDGYGLHETVCRRYTMLAGDRLPRHSQSVETLIETGGGDCNEAAADGRTPLKITRNPRTAAILRNCISKQDAARMQKDTSQTMH